MNRLLVLSYRFPPETYPLAMRVKYFVNHLRGENWEIHAVTAAEEAEEAEHVRVHHVAPRSPEGIVNALHSLRLQKLTELFLWPDPFVFWVYPALRNARQIIREHRIDAIAVFMMPFSQGLAGLQLKRETGLPLIMNFNDSLTCSDMHPSHPSRLHYYLAKKLEDWYVQASDASIFVSKRNMERVRDRQPPSHRDTFHLIRRGTRPLPSTQSQDEGAPPFRIVYTGGTGGWYKFLDRTESPSLLKRLYRGWKELGRHEVAELDHRTHGPVFVGRAVRQVLEHRPEWAGNIRVDVYGVQYPDPVTDAVLDQFGLRDIVTLHGRVPHEEALRQMQDSDLLFMALPDRVDGTPGGRISAKTFEYLMTDRPILAALPPGENREYLADKPGVHLTDPSDVDAMASVIDELAGASFEGRSLAVERSEVQAQLRKTKRAEAFDEIVERVTPPDASTPSAVRSG